MRMSPQCLGSSGANWQAQQWMDKFEQTGDLIGRVDGYLFVVNRHAIPHEGRNNRLDMDGEKKTLAVLV